MNASTGTTSLLVKGVAALALLVGIYLAYVFMWQGGSKNPAYAKLLDTMLSGRSQPASGNKLTAPPALFPGGELTLSFWLAIDDWNHRFRQFKPVLQLEAPTSTAAEAGVTPLVAMLHPVQNDLIFYIRTSGAGSSSDPMAMTSDGTRKAVLAPNSTISASTMDALGTNSAEERIVVKDIELQRWINVVLVLNGKACDVYMNGKLQQSRILQNLPALPTSGAVVAAPDGGFGGFLSTVEVFSAVQSPAEIYAIYQKGPSTAGSGLKGVLSYLFNMFSINVTFATADGRQSYNIQV
jgi:hypothetical protein